MTAGIALIRYAYRSTNHKYNDIEVRYDRTPRGLGQWNYGYGTPTPEWQWGRKS
jgi:hypothetical protein